MLLLRSHFSTPTTTEAITDTASIRPRPKTDRRTVEQKFMPQIGEQQLQNHHDRNASEQQGLRKIQMETDCVNERQLKR